MTHKNNMAIIYPGTIILALSINMVIRNQRILTKKDKDHHCRPNNSINTHYLWVDREIGYLLVHIKQAMIIANI